MLRWVYLARANIYRAQARIYGGLAGACLAMARRLEKWARKEG